MRVIFSGDNIASPPFYSTSYYIKITKKTTSIKYFKYEHLFERSSFMWYYLIINWKKVYSVARQTETRQIEVLRYIHEQVSQKGYPPTVREIGEAVQLSSTSTVHGHLARLEKKDLFNVTLRNHVQSN